MFFKHFVIQLTIFTLLASCNQNKKYDNSKSSKTKEADSITLSAQQYYSDLSKKMNITPLDKDADSFELRLWVGSMVVEKDLLIVRLKDSAWETQKLKYYIDQDNVTYFKKLSFNPKLKLASLLDSITKMNLDELISQREIPGFVDNLADGVTYNLEIITKNHYRILIYHCPERFAKNEINNKKFLDLLLLLDKHFHYWLPICM